MSKISDIFKFYRNALNLSRDKYIDLYAHRAENARRFYDKFLKNLTCDFSSLFADASTLRALHSQIECFFGGSEIAFIAIDGHNYKRAFEDFVVFAACAYGAKGSIELGIEPPVIRYHKWAIDRDVSMVTYIPVPFSEFADVVEANRRETFLISDSERVDLSGIDLSIMALAEIYLAYDVASSSKLDAPRLILLDKSPSSLIADVAFQPEEVSLLDYPYDRRRLRVEDTTIALAHPFNSALGIPTLKKFRQYTALLAEFHRQRKQEINLDEFVRNKNLTLSDLTDAINFLTKPRQSETKDITIPPFARVEERGGETWLVTKTDCVASWEYTVSLFANICKRLFIDKDQNALLYEAEDEFGAKRLRWMSPEDIRFLTAVGVRALIEKCWENKILLTGIVKDSTSRYFSRNYLGAMRILALENAGEGYSELNALEIGQLPWTDRILLQLLPHADENLNAPWATVEFDSTFMTLYAADYNGKPQISGTQQFITAPERLFARSLAQFFFKREKETPLEGKVIFIDRLVHPEWDADALEVLKIETPKLGKMQPLCYPTCEDRNIGQLINMYLLNILTRNHFPELIGYPDPLHKADWGAKAVGRKMAQVVESSTFAFRAAPLHRTMRDIRDSYRRR